MQEILATVEMMTGQNQAKHFEIYLWHVPVGAHNIWLFRAVSTWSCKNSAGTQGRLYSFNDEDLTILWMKERKNPLAFEAHTHNWLDPTSNENERQRGIF